MSKANPKTYEQPANISLRVGNAPQPWIGDSELERLKGNVELDFFSFEKERKMFDQSKQEELTSVLVVDDNMFNTYSFRELLSKKFKIQSSEAHNGD
jgi:hypothetical protein